MEQMSIVKQWQRFEWSGAAEGSFGNPVAELRVLADFTSPDGTTTTVEGFWDGDDNWRVRFSPNQTGVWALRVRSEPLDSGLDEESASFECIPYTGDNPLFLHGRVNAKPGERFLRHADGTPFFWLGDTAWNGPLKASMDDWGLYLRDRQEKRFNTIQFVATQWLAAAGNADARVAYVGAEPIEIDPVFFQWLDRRIDAMNDAGFLGAAVIAWTATWNRPALGLSPGTSLPEHEIVRLGRYLLARYGANHMCWILAGDGHYESVEAERWRRIGRALFAGVDALATIHPGGHVWVEDEFRNEPWFRFNGYQSGHWKNDDAARWITSGPVRQAWRKDPGIPHINLEFCYEAHKDFDTHTRFDERDIRRDAYGSLLAGVPAGLTYGCHGIWSWEAKPNPPMNHPKTGYAPAWSEALKMPGSSSMKHLRDIFESIEWWRLLPSPELIAGQSENSSTFGQASAARSEAGDLAVIYLPQGGPVAVNTELLGAHLVVELIDPASGTRKRLSPPTTDKLIAIQTDVASDAFILFCADRSDPMV